jgi:Ca-activated chloride channel family protein
MTVELDATVGSPLPASGGFVTTEITVEPTGSKAAKSVRNVALCLDTSGSMGGDAIEELRRGAKRALDELDDRDFLTLVSFSSNTDVIVEPTRFGDVSRSSIENDIDSLHARGGTDLYNGVETAARQLSSVRSSAPTVDRILLLTDGYGDRSSDLDAYQRLGRDVDDMGVSIVTGGIGYYHEDAMMALSDASGGTADHLESPADITEFLDTNVSAAGDVVASEPQLRIDPGAGFLVPAVHPEYEERKRVYRIVEKGDDRIERQLPRVERSGDAVVVDLADVAADRGQSLILEFLGQRKTPGLSYTLAEVELTADGEVLADATLEIDYCDREERSKRPVDEGVEKRRFISKVVADLNDEDVEDADVTRFIDATAKDHADWDDVVEKARAKVDEDRKVVRREGEKAVVEDPFK